MSVLDHAAVDAVISQPDAGNASDAVSLPAAELVRLRGIERDHQGLEQSTAAGFIERDLSSALASVGNLMPHAAEHLQKLWQGDFEARRIDGRWVVQAKGGGEVGEVVNDATTGGLRRTFPGPGPEKPAFPETWKPEPRREPPSPTRKARA